MTFQEGEFRMSNEKAPNLILEYNKKLRDVILQEKLLPKDCSGKVTFYMELQNDTGEPRIIPKNYTCSSEYLEYFWVEFKYAGKNYVVSLFYRDFDCERGDIHVMPGVLQVWEKTPYIEGEEYKFPSGSQIEAYTQTVNVSNSKKIVWEPLIGYGKTPKRFVWAPFMDLNRLSEFIFGSIKTPKSEISVSDEENNKQEENLGKLQTYIDALPNSEGVYKKPTRGNYKYLYRWTKNYKFQENNCFISPYKHINTDYGYFIRFDGKPTAYMIKHAGEYPNKLQESKFVINYEYFNSKR